MLISSVVRFHPRGGFSERIILLAQQKSGIYQSMLTWGPLPFRAFVSIILPHFLQTQAKYGVSFFLLQKCHGSVPFPFSATPALIRLL